MTVLTASHILVLPFPSAAPFFGAEETQLVYPGKSSYGIEAVGIDLSQWLAPGDNVVSSDVSISPSGDDYDLVASKTVLFGNIVAINTASGIPGSDYSIEFSVTTQDLAQESFACLQPINFASLATLPPLNLPPPGAPPLKVCMNLAATGTTLEDAYPMVCQFNGFSVIPDGSGARLPVNPGVPIVVINQAVGGNILLVYPPDRNTSLNALPAGEPVEIPAPIVPGTVTQSTFVYGTVSPTPTSITAY